MLGGIGKKEGKEEQVSSSSSDYIIIRRRGIEKGAMGRYGRRCLCLCSERSDRCNMHYAVGDMQCWELAVKLSNCCITADSFKV